MAYATTTEVAIDQEYVDMLNFVQEQVPAALLKRPIALGTSRSGVRSLVNMLCKPLWAPLEELVSFRDETLRCDGRSFRVRVYTRKRDEGAQAPAAMLYLHSGGGVIGNIETEHYLVLEHVKRTGHRAVSVEYSLAPEHKYPAGLDDCTHALEWLHTRRQSLQVAPDAPLYVAGVSQGSNFSFNLTARQARRGAQGVPIAKAILVQGTFASCNGTTSPAWSKLGNLFSPLLPPLMQFFSEQYSEPKDQKANAEVSPVLAQLPANLPPYHFITSGMDALNSDNDQMIAKLREAGASIVHDDLGEVPHCQYLYGALFKKANERLFASFERAASSLQGTAVKPAL